MNALELMLYDTKQKTKDYITNGKFPRIIRGTIKDPRQSCIGYTILGLPIGTLAGTVYGILSGDNSVSEDIAMGCSSGVFLGFTIGCLRGLCYLGKQKINEYKIKAKEYNQNLKGLKLRNGIKD